MTSKGPRIGHFSIRFNRLTARAGALDAQQRLQIGRQALEQLGRVDPRLRALQDVGVDVGREDAEIDVAAMPQHIARNRCGAVGLLA
jgi:hypothetical protein